MKKQVILIVGLFSFLTITFLITQYLELSILKDPTETLSQGGFLSAIISMALLAADMFLPTPSTIIMIANGYIFGLSTGLFISFIGMMIGNLIGFGVGKYGGQWLENFFPTEKRTSTANFMEKWGVLAIIISRPIPVLAESVMLLAGTTKMSFFKIFWSTTLGIFPVVVIYTLVGVYAVEWQENLLIFSFVSFFAVMVFVISKLYKPLTE